MYKRRHKIDWDEEFKKTARSHLRGVKATAVAFVAVILFLAAVKVTHRELPMDGVFLVLGGLAAGTFILILLGRRSSK
ncbi:MAG TPA: hypothetical protein PK013_02320 [Thermosynergistes sp.]|nr:hypothetical protein [Thermosynergistes sp.]